MKSLHICARVALLCVAMVSAASCVVAASPSKLAILHLPEELKDDPQASQVDLAYRVSIRPHFSYPIAMTLYIQFLPESSNSGPKWQGRYVVKWIRDGSKDTLETKESDLTEAQVTAILRVIFEQEVFNLGTPPLFAPEEIAVGRGEMDPSAWCFERLVNKTAHPEFGVPSYMQVIRARADSGPAREVFRAFSDVGLKLLENKSPGLEP